MILIVSNRLLANYLTKKQVFALFYIKKRFGTFIEKTSECEGNFVLFLNHKQFKNSMLSII